jgi:chaperonin GroEL
MSKIILYGDEAREKIITGARKLAKTVAVTMGPHGRNVVIGKSVGAPTITKDGVSVAREVVLEDPAEELGCRLVKEVAGRTADVAGDGTTTATVLAEAILSEGMKVLSSGETNPVFFRDGINHTLSLILKNIDDMSKNISGFDDIKHIASISANNDISLGTTIAQAFEMVGRNGLVTAEAYAGLENRVKYTDGVELKSGYSTSALLQNGEDPISLENAYVLVCERDITHVQDFVKLLEKLHTENKAILIIAKTIRQEAIDMIVTNRKKGRLNAVTVEYPVMGKNNSEWLSDLALLCGTRVFGEDKGIPLSSASINDLGFARKIIISKYSTTIIGGYKDENLVKERAALYREALENIVGDMDRKDVRDRLAFLNNKAAVIGVGYSTEAELREKGDRVEDAVCATKAAIESGILPGGGIALLRASMAVDLESMPPEYRAAADVLTRACKRPFYQIMENGYQDPAEIEKKIVSNSSQWYGYNLHGRKFGDMLEMGVLDPKKVTKTAIQNAVSITLLLLNTDAILSEDLNNPSGWQPPAGWRPPSNNNLNHSF